MLNNDLLSVLSFVILNFLSFAASFLFLRYILAPEGIVEYLAIFFTFFFAQIILTLEILGVCGKLYLVNVFWINLFILIVIWSGIKIFRLKPKYEFFSNLYPALKGLKFNQAEIICLSILFGFAVSKIAVNLVNPPFGWDSLNYHFTFPVEWLKHANLNNPITINDDLGPTYYPINGSLIYLWLIFPFKNVFMADLGQIPFYVISFITLYGICRKLNIHKEYSFYAACLFTATPNYFKQMAISYVDVMVCGWFLLGFYFLLSFYKDKRLRDVLFFAISIGMLVGTKTTALPFAALLVVAFLLVCAISRSKIVLFLGFGAILIIIFGGYGYIRNFIQTGNPFYPMEIVIFGKEIFKGIFDKTNYLSHVKASDYAITKILFSEGLGAGIILFLIPGYFLAVYKFIKNLELGAWNLEKIPSSKLQALSSKSFLVLLIPPALFLIWRYLIPLANLRYIYAAVAIGYTVAFIALTREKPYIIIIRVLTAICLLASAGELAKRQELILGLVLSVVLFFIFRNVFQRAVDSKARHWLIIGLALIPILSVLNTDYNKNEFKRYVSMVKYSGFWPDAAKAWRWLDENISGSNIAYVGRPVPFPLYGRNFKNNVFYVSVNKTEPAMAHYFKDSFYRWGPDFMELHKSLEEKNNYRGNADYNVWLKNLLKRKTDYLFVYSLHQTKEVAFPMEDVWANTHQETFAQVFSNQTVHVYKLR